MTLDSGSHDALDAASTKQRWLTTEQLATHLSVSTVTLKLWRARARGPRFHKIGRKVRYERADVDAWLASCAVGAPAGAPV